MRNQIILLVVIALLWTGECRGEKSTYLDFETGMEFVLVRGGCYQMGDTLDDGDDNEKPVHEVCVDDFYLGKYEVTQGEWQKVMGNNPSHFKKGDRYPVEQVSWNDVQDYIRKLNKRSGRNYRLPTEAEWEYAAREGGKEVRFGTGKNTIGPDEANFYANKTESYSRSGKYRQQTVPVDSFVANSLGLYNMSGNVWEWCQNWYGKDYYSSNPRMNREVPSTGEKRVNRGGGWSDDPWFLRAAARYGNLPGVVSDDLGFRLSRSVQQ